MVVNANIAAIRVKNGAKHPTYSPRVYDYNLNHYDKLLLFYWNLRK